MARPRKALAVTPTEVRNYARLGATDAEIAAMAGCSAQTIVRRFKDELVRGRAERHLKLRAFQWKAAEAGNVTMMIWLGKQELKQTDKVETAAPVDAKRPSHTGVLRTASPVSAAEWSAVAQAQQADLRDRTRGAA